MRRLTRPLGPLGRRQGRAEAAPSTLIARANAGQIDALAPAPRTSSRLPTVGALFRTLGARLLDADAIEHGPRTSAEAWDPADGPSPNPLAPPSPTDADSRSMASFRRTAAKMLRSRPAPAPVPAEVRLDLAQVRETITRAIDPRAAIPAGFAARTRFAPGFTWSPRDPLQPVIVHPRFPQPMYKPLADKSPDWILPGLFEHMPADRVALAETNQPFIEAYMLGLNHEMSRELLWREYPTDQRGTYFRQFWDPAGTGSGAPADGDITPIEAWTADSALGGHNPRSTGTTDGELVLVVRAELLRRYPSTVVYARRAVDGPELADETQVRRPLFTARMAPDVMILGFDLTLAEIRATPGWFFVFEEQPGEPRFGLDHGDGRAPPTALSGWDELAWGHLPSDVRYIDLAAELSVARTFEGQPLARGTWHATGPSFARGADHGFITFRRPARVAIYAADLLP